MSERIARLANLGQAAQYLVECYERGVELPAIVEYLARKATEQDDTPVRSPFGVHEGCLDWIDGVPGWYVDTVHVWQADRLDYTAITARGHAVIARLNNGYKPDGTIPTPDRYQAFADRVGYVVGRSTGCQRWIIGNEPNHPNEFPASRPIYPDQYADCYRRCRARIHAQAGHEADEVLLAPVAPWCAIVHYPGNDRGGWGDWVQYVVDVATHARAFDGFALHTYVRQHDPAQVTSLATMGPPFEDRYSSFRTYRDFLAGLHAWQGKPVYVTEFDPATDPPAPTWLDTNNGLLQAAYAEIARWNAGGWPIRCLVLYRGANRDRWYFGDKLRLRQDLRTAIAAWRGSN